MNRNAFLDKGYMIAMILNVLFLAGLTFITQTENLYLIIPFAILMLINAIYLVVKAAKYNKSKSEI